MSHQSKLLVYSSQNHLKEETSYLILYQCRQFRGTFQIYLKFLYNLHLNVFSLSPANVSKSC